METTLFLASCPHWGEKKENEKKVERKKTNENWHANLLGPKSMLVPRPKMYFWPSSFFPVRFFARYFVRQACGVLKGFQKSQRKSRRRRRRRKREKAKVALAKAGKKSHR